MTDVVPKPTKDGARPHKSEQDAASEEIVEVAPGVLRMQLPIWMPGLGHVNMYGLVDDKGLAVVDPGLPGPQSWKALKQRLKDAGFRLRDVHTVIVTHSHPDHFDLATLLRLGRATPIVVPEVPRESLLAMDMAARLRQLGFAAVRTRNWPTSMV